MANDFKRMWTKEEIKDTYFLNIEYFEVGSVPITKEIFEKIVSKNILCTIDADGNKFYYPCTRDYSYDINERQKYYTMTSAYNYELGVIQEGEIYYLEFSSSRNINENDFENLVREVPTDVSIIEDQGKLELMLEHDGNVLAINDTPNQFLQRRLDKPSAEWDGDTSPTDLQTWLEEKLSTMHVGQVVSFRDINGNYTNIYCLCTYVGDVLTLVPLGVFSGIDSLVTNIYVDISEQQFTISEYGENDKFFDFVDFQNFKLF